MHIVKLLALLFSLLFHPLLLPTYAGLLIYWTNANLFSAYHAKDIFWILAMLGVNTFVFPILALVLVWRLGFIPNLFVPQAKERLIPYLTSGVFYIWSFVVFHRSDAPQYISIIVLGATITLFLCFLVSLFHNISIHASGMGALFVVTYGAALLAGESMQQLPVGAAVLAGLVGSFRVYLGAHSLREVFTGYLMGVSGQLMAISFL